MKNKTYVVGGTLSVEVREINTKYDQDLGVVINHDLSSDPTMYNAKRTVVELQFTEAEALVEMLLQLPEIRRYREMRASQDMLPSKYVLHANDDIPF
mgnify:CR=1 FL=1